MRIHVYRLLVRAMSAIALASCSPQTAEMRTCVTFVDAVSDSDPPSAMLSGSGDYGVRVAVCIDGATERVDSGALPLDALEARIRDVATLADDDVNDTELTLLRGSNQECGCSSPLVGVAQMKGDAGVRTLNVATAGAVTQHRVRLEEGPRGTVTSVALQDPLPTVPAGGGVVEITVTVMGGASRADISVAGSVFPASASVMSAMVKTNANGQAVFRIFVPAEVASIYFRASVGDVFDDNTITQR